MQAGRSGLLIPSPCRPGGAGAPAARRMGRDAVGCRPKHAVNCGWRATAGCPRPCFDCPVAAAGKACDRTMQPGRLAGLVLLAAHLKPPAAPATIIYAEVGMAYCRASVAGNMVLVSGEETVGSCAGESARTAVCVPQGRCTCGLGEAACPGASGEPRARPHRITVPAAWSYPPLSFPTSSLRHGSLCRW